MRKGLSEIGGPFFVVCKKRAAHDERLIVVISKAGFFVKNGGELQIFMYFSLAIRKECKDILLNRLSIHHHEKRANTYYWDCPVESLDSLFYSFYSRSYRGRLFFMPFRLR